VSGLIKSDAAGLDARVRALVFDAAGNAAAPAPDPELVLLRERALDLEAALAERDATAVQLSEAAQAAYEEGEAAGREAGRAEADAGRAETLERLQENAESAVAALEERLEATDRLAALLARTCLDKMFGAAGPRGALVEDLIRHQLDALRQEAVIEIHVSAEDFDCPDAAAAAAPACKIIVSEALASGDCTIRLGLGGLEIGLGRQWDTLRAALDGMIETEAAA
jgi:flagellar biosynthesis/type III secretory pathway protein FliH